MITVSLFNKRFIFSRASIIPSIVPLLEKYYREYKPKNWLFENNPSNFITKIDKKMLFV